MNMRAPIITRVSPHDRETRLKGTHSLDPIQWLHLTDVEDMRKKIEDVLKNSVDIVLEKKKDKLKRTIYEYDDLHCPECSHVQIINEKTCAVPDKDKPINKFIDHLTLCKMDQATLDMQNENDVIHDVVLSLLRLAQDKQKRVQVTPFGDHRPNGYVLKLPITSPLAHLIARGVKVFETSRRIDEFPDQFVISVKIPIDDVPSSRPRRASTSTFKFCIDFENVFKINVLCKEQRDRKEKTKIEAAEKLKVRVAAGQAKNITGTFPSYDQDNDAKQKVKTVGGQWLQSSGRAEIRLLDDTVDGVAMKRTEEKAKKSRQKIQATRRGVALLSASDDPGVSNTVATEAKPAGDVDDSTQVVADVDMKDVNTRLRNALLTAIDSKQVAQSDDTTYLSSFCASRNTETPIADDIMEECGNNHSQTEPVSTTLSKLLISNVAVPNGTNGSSSSEQLDKSAVVQSDSLLKISQILSNEEDDAVMEVDIGQESSAPKSSSFTRSQSLRSVQRKPVNHQANQASTRPTHMLRKKSQQSIKDDCVVLDSSDDGSSVKQEVIELDSSSSSSESCVVVFDKSGR